MAVRELGIGPAVMAQARADLASGVANLRERRAWLVAGLSLLVMSGELLGGRWLNSLALTSDGLHTASHAGVLLIAAVAYVYVRRRDGAGAGARVLNRAALLSGVLLALAAVFIGFESLERLRDPEPVRFAEAAVVTALGLGVSGVSVLLLRGAHGAAHEEDAHGHGHGRDLNLWAAYLHMLADLITSLLALAALVLGAWTGWARLDSAVGALNTAVVALFAWRLLRTAWAALRAQG